MKSALQNYKLIPFSLPDPLYFFVLVVLLMLAGCGSQEETAPDSSQQTLSFKISDSMLSRLDSGSLSATITVTNLATGSSFTQAMTISGTTAEVTLNGLSLGSTNFTIEFTYNDGTIGPLVVASDTLNLDVVAGSNTLPFDIAVFDTDIYDADGDGLSNLVELDDGLSVTSPIDDVCILGVSLFGNCTFGL